MVNYYQVLGVPESATLPEIKQAYKKLAVAYHPDKHGGNRSKEEVFKSISEAYTVLSDPQKRAMHDQKLAYTRYVPPTYAASQPKAPTGPNPYGTPFSYNFGGQPQTAQHQWRPTAERRRRTPNLQDVAIALLVIAFVLMGGIWINASMNRRAAEISFAEGDFITALQYDRNFAPAWWASAKAQMRYGNYKASLEDLQRAILLSDSVPGFWYMKLAQLHTILGQDDFAKTDARYFLSLHPRADSAMLILASIYLRQNLVDSSLGILKDVPIGEGTSENHRMVFNHLSGLGNFRAQNFLLAEKYFSQNADYNYNVPEDLYLRGLARLRLADSVHAFTDLKAASEYGSKAADSVLAHDFNH